MRYEETSMVEGRQYLPYIKNFFFKRLTEDNFFVEPWENRALRDCAEFRLEPTRERSDEILFFVADPDLIAFLQSTDQAYLYGTYNQINVCQMRAKVTIKGEVDHPETETVRSRLRASIVERTDRLLDGLRHDEAGERLTILQNGIMFSMQVSGYAYGLYQRG